MHKYHHLPIAAAVMLGSGCSHVGIKAYSGIIQRVETSEFTGYSVSPASSSASPVVHPAHVYVSVNDPRIREPRIVRIDFLDVADPSALGQAGNRVTFVLAGDLPIDGHIAAEAMRRYAIAK